MIDEHNNCFIIHSRSFLVYWKTSMLSSIDVLKILVLFSYFATSSGDKWQFSSAGILQIPADVVRWVVLLMFLLGFCQVIQTSMWTNRHVEVRYNLENSILHLVNGDSKTPKLLSVGQSWLKQFFYSDLLTTSMPCGSLKILLKLGRGIFFWTRHS